MFIVGKCQRCLQCHLKKSWNYMGGVGKQDLNKFWLIKHTKWSLETI